MSDTIRRGRGIWERTPDFRARMSAARKKAWADPAVRARMSAASKKALADPAVRARMRAGQRRRHQHHRIEENRQIRRMVERRTAPGMCIVCEQQKPLPPHKICPTCLARAEG